MLLSLRVTTATKFTTVTVMTVLPGDCGTASALAAAMDVFMPEARRQVPSPDVTPVTRRAVVTNDSSGSYGRNSLSGIGAWRADGPHIKRLERIQRETVAAP
jgi:hypothetical protein